MKCIGENQHRSQEFAHAVARVIIASYFMAKAVGLIIDPTGMGQFLAISDVPDYLRWPNAGFEFIAALAIMVGFQTRMAAVLLALYLFWSSFILNYNPGDAYLIGAFWRDLAMIGGLLLLFSHGRGRYALDNWLLRRAERREAVAESESEAAPETTG